MERTVLVFGATGNTGVELCKALSAQGVAHTAFVRKGSEGKLPPETPEVTQGEVLNAEDVKSALAEKEYTDVIIALGSRDLKTVNLRSEGTRHVVEGLVALGKSAKLHLVSSHGVGDSYARLKGLDRFVIKLFLSKAIQDHNEQEAIAMTNAGGYHIVRPVGLKNDPAKEKVYASNEGKMPSNSITRADVAAYLVEQMLKDASGTISVCNG